MLFKIFQEQRNIEDRGWLAEGLRSKGAEVKNLLNRVEVGTIRKKTFYVTFFIRVTSKEGGLRGTRSLDKIISKKHTYVLTYIFNAHLRECVLACFFNSKRIILHFIILNLKSFFLTDF